MYIKIIHNNVLFFNVGLIRMIKSRIIKWAGQVARMGDSRGAYKVLVGKPDGRKPLGSPRRRWEDNIKTSLRSGMGMDGQD